MQPLNRPFATQKPAAVPKGNGKATASLILGLASLVCGCFTGLPATIVGFLSLREISLSKGAQQGKGLAIAGIAIGIFTSLVTLVGGGVVLFTVLSSGVQAIAEAGNAQVAENDLKQIGLAVHLYHDTYKQFPVIDNSDEMRQALSWRVRVLPFLEEASLHDRFDYESGWNSPTNMPLAAERPDCFTPRFDGFTADGTNYLAVMNADKDDPSRVGIQTNRRMESRVNFGQIPDGASNTIMVVVADNTTQQGPWTMGYDLPVDLQNPAVGLQEINGTYLVLFVDGSTRQISKDIDAELLSNLMNRADGRTVVIP